jgi:hypothetical protein
MTASKRKKVRRQPPKKRIKVPGNSSASNPFKIEWPQTGGNKLVGAYIQRRDANYLNLLAVHKGTTTSQMLRQVIEGMIREAVPEDEIIDSLVDMAVQEWESRLKANQGEPGWLERIDLFARWREYQQEIRLLLVKRNIADSLIVRIIRKLEIAQGGF